MYEQEKMTVMLTDEEGLNSEHLLIDSMEYEDRIYCFLVPVEQADMEEQDVIIMEYTEQDGEIVLNAVENEILLDEIFDAYSELIEQDED